MTTSRLTPQDVDVDLLWHCFERAVEMDTAARVGENGIPLGDPRIERFAADVAAPVLRDLGAEVTIDSANNVIATFGPLTGTELALVSYCAIHHGNEMIDPLHAVRVRENGSEHWRGLGASQGKGGFAAVCGAIDALRRDNVELSGSLVAIVSSEGSSTHHSSEALFEHLRPWPAGVVLAVGTGNQLSLGNRGRVDVIVTIAGIATHSSAPDRGSNPIPTVTDVLARLGSLPRDDTEHPLLGRRTVVPYKLICGPVAPHTIPATCELVLDCRLLPGDDPTTAVEEVAEAMSGLPVSVSQGATMLPAIVELGDPIVTALQAGARVALGRHLDTFYPPYTFDAGFACSVGVPAVMCGPSTTDTGGSDVLGEDRVALDQVRDAAAVYAASTAVLAGRRE
jgi:succinyl-diaminopimelate desuccinylase